MNFIVECYAVLKPVFKAYLESFPAYLFVKRYIFKTYLLLE